MSEGGAEASDPGDPESPGPAQRVPPEGGAEGERRKGGRPVGRGRPRGAASSAPYGGGTPEPAADPVLVFDGHNDTVLDLLLREGTPRERSFLRRSEEGHVDLPRAREGGLAGGFFSVFVPALEPAPPPAPVPKNASFPPLDPRHAAAFAERMVARLRRLEGESAGALRVVASVRQLEECMQAGGLAAILHFEGAEPLDPSLSSLEDWHERGLRSLGITWSRDNAFGHGVPFRYPSTPDTGPGLTEAGRTLVGRCEQLGILIDLAHLNERGFWDVAELTERPLVVTHAGAHALCPASRNLTDRQLDAVAASGGVVGVVFAAAFLRADGCENADTPVSRIAEHVLYMVERIGAEHVALGSDFDGALIPRTLGGVAGLPHLLDALRAGGLGEADLERIAWRNWPRVLRDWWG
ncbi:MAG TPA: dipeptidase [Longimicrobiales bacterium]|nr:dipeptidase [Longimicrobiales bacterium]